MSYILQHSVLFGGMSLMLVISILVLVAVGTVCHIRLRRLKEKRDELQKNLNSEIVRERIG